MQYLLIETPQGIRRIELARDRLTVGRLAENDLPLPYAQISRQHAELGRFSGQWWIRDRGSTNGLHFGSQRVQQHQLAPGDRILLSPDVAIWFVDDAVAPPPNLTPDRSREVQPAPATSATMAPPPTPAARSSGPAGFPTAGPATDDHYRRTMPAQPSSLAHMTLHICQTCGRRTAPDVEECYACHHSIARSCDVCHTNILPAQERCPRCQTPNPAFVGRTNPRPGR